MAQWLAGQGFPRVSVLKGGLGAWRRAGLAVETPLERAASPGGPGGEAAEPVQASGTFLPSLAERYLREGTLPARRRLTTLFADLAGSTSLLASHSPEVVLEVVQRFFRTVSEVALAYCGDVKAFEGDGALLYFESTKEAALAALAIRDAVAARPEEGARPIACRLSLSVGEVVIGVVGSALRQAVELIGPTLSVGARLLKTIEPGGVIATREVVEALGREAPDVAARFKLLDAAFPVPASGGIVVATYAIA